MPDPINLGASLPFFLAAFVFGYLMGSVPYGLLLTKLAGLGDIRAIGSGNIGTTNVLRTGRKDLAALTLIADALKGMAAVLLAALWAGPGAAAFAAIGALVGHCWPVWLKFKGGKGVATFLGVLLALSWPIALVFIGVWILTAVITRYSSASALLGTLAVILATLMFNAIALFEIALVLVAIIWWKHRDNIGRLLRGEESRIGHKGEPADQPPADHPS